ncbi:hypothetical protein ACFOMD_16055 [Sphingoaurantiacus capsulatus]|uniref:Uncharacterized protein n=1 Tax=Sphingoaurantiacus capsulatus TaxID=1771310 RepID=A0ABV7XD43_9SPHN
MIHEFLPEAGQRLAAFDVRAQADASAPGRVLAFFAQLGLTPSRVQMRRFDDELRINVTQDGLSEHAAEVIAEKLRAAVLVRAVYLEHQLCRVAA